MKIDTLWTGSVKRGEFVRQVRGNGTLVPEEVRWVATTEDGRVERVPVRPGTPVDADTPITELSNPVLEREAQDAQLELAAAEAALENLRVQLKGKQLDMEEALALAQAALDLATATAERDQQLLESGLTAKYDLQVSLAKVKELRTHVTFAQQRIDMTKQSSDAQITAEEAKVEQLRALVRLRQAQVANLIVRAKAPGVVQQILVEVGQQVASATPLAKVAIPDKLKGQLKIPETQGRDVAVDQPVSVDTRQGVARGHVARIDPAVENGTVLVEVAMDEALPKGARPDLSIEGTIEIEHLDNILYVERPVAARENAWAGLFVVSSDGAEATRRDVRLGKLSVNSIEVVDGLEEGVRVILSDMAQWEGVDRIRLR